MAIEASTDDRSLAPVLLARVAAAFRSNAGMYRDMGSALYGCLFAQAADDPELVELASHGQEGARPVHLLSAVHDLLLRDPRDPLAAWFATLTSNPAPPETAFPELQRFCRERHGELLEVLRSRSVQSTYVERCWALRPALAHVADQAGEPLNLVEIGCSAGVLLTFDQYAYDLPGQGRIGPAEAPMVLSGRMTGDPPADIPAIGARIGIDLAPLDAASPDDRRWLLALCLPELREEQARLGVALDTVARSSIRLIKGDAPERLEDVLAMTSGPVCVFHSVCLLYWPEAAKAALHRQLLDIGRSREVWRLGFELSGHFEAVHAGRHGQGETTARPEGATFDVTLVRYAGGEAEQRVLAHMTPDFATLYWHGHGDPARIAGRSLAKRRSWMPREDYNPRSASASPIRSTHDN